MLNYCKVRSRTKRTLRQLHMYKTTWIRQLFSANYPSKDIIADGRKKHFRIYRSCGLCARFPHESSKVTKLRQHGKIWGATFISVGSSGRGDAAW
eukprot:1183901-Prorocentrum_minimum.AAC.2